MSSILMPGCRRLGVLKQRHGNDVAFICSPIGFLCRRDWCHSHMQEHISRRPGHLYPPLPRMDIRHACSIFPTASHSSTRPSIIPFPSNGIAISPKAYNVRYLGKLNEIGLYRSTRSIGVNGEGANRSMLEQIAVVFSVLVKLEEEPVSENCARNTSNP